MRHFKTRKGAFKGKLPKFGDLITFDFVDMGKATEMGWRDDKELLVIRDRIHRNGTPIPGARQVDRDGRENGQEVHRRTEGDVCIL